MLMAISYVSSLLFFKKEMVHSIFIEWTKNKKRKRYLISIRTFSSNKSIIIERTLYFTVSVETELFVIAESRVSHR